MTLFDDWQIGPRNRWAYQHVGEVVPTVRVACGAASPLRAGPAIDLPSPPWLDALAVLRDGALVLVYHGQLVAVDRGAATVTVMLSSWPAATDEVAEAAQFKLLAR